MLNCANFLVPIIPRHHHHIRDRSKLPTIFVIIVALYVICCPNYPQTTLNPGIYPLNFTTGRIFFGIVTIPSSTRRFLPWENFMKNVQAENYHKALFICPWLIKYRQYSISPDKKFYNMPNSIPKDYKSDIDRMAKRLTGAKYVKNHEEFDWYWTLTDDVSIDIPEINKMLAKISLTKDPRKDIIILGECVAANWSSINKTYLQGGVGYILSRKATLEFLDYAPEWFRNAPKLDDVAIRVFIDHLNLTMNDVSIHQFHGTEIGFPFNQTTFEENIATCPKEYTPIDDCGYGNNNFYTLQELSALHLSNPKVNIREWSRIMNAKKTKKNIYYYHHTDFNITFCTKD